ncbi:FUSC family protein [Psychrobacter sp. YP14]|uniref:FUSC family protein n=1 Tax=Psychrobacter sp. YP14 TaxID=2203895 RepID=UPI000D7E7789|nr:FUSC family protein [Psychrobacter sp. YP14]AWT48183.1 FUSC family protein [Psychrobacter sp. YP14]
MSIKRLKQIAKREAEHLFTVRPSAKPWHVSLSAALIIASTILIGALYHNLPMGILASLGAMIILNQPVAGSLRQRQGLLLLMGIIMVLSFSVGLIAHQVQLLKWPLFTLLCFIVVAIGRYMHLPPPGSMFVLMASVIAIFMPGGWEDMPGRIGVVAAGALYAWVMSLFYNLAVVGVASEPAPSKHYYELGLITESLIVCFFVVLSLELALWLDMPYPYWVPVSCYIIMQGMQLRTMWIRQLHRVLGTGIGVFVAAFLLSFSWSNVGVALVIFCLLLWIETLVSRHYASAVIMITPLTIFIAEYGKSAAHTEVGAMAYQGIMQARFLDTLLGCVVALLGGVVMQSTWLRRPLMTLEAKVFQDKIRLQK